MALVRCPIHGLTYDRDRSSGCLRCMQPARAAARDLERRLRSPWADLMANPTKRAVAGLALSLVLGLVPAAYYALGMCGGEVRAIRARQAELSTRLRTDELDAEFDRLDVAIAGVRRRGMRNTALCWLLVTSIAGAGWARLTSES